MNRHGQGRDLAWHKKAAWQPGSSLAEGPLLLPTSSPQHCPGGLPMPASSVSGILGGFTVSLLLVSPHSPFRQMFDKLHITTLPAHFGSPTPVPLSVQTRVWQSPTPSLGNSSFRQLAAAARAAAAICSARDCTRGSLLSPCWHADMLLALAQTGRADLTVGMACGPGRWRPFWRSVLLSPCRSLSLSQFSSLSLDLVWDQNFLVLDSAGT